MKSCISLFMLLITVSAIAETSSFSLGQEAFSNKEYEKAMAVWLPLAENGLSDAQDTVAYLYAQGLGVQKDLQKAIYWYKRSAEQGHVEAKYHLGVYYRLGKGVKKNSQLAEKYLREAYCGGYSLAIIGLAALHSDGLLSIKNEAQREDIEKHIEWLKDPRYREYLLHNTRENLRSKETELASNKIKPCG